MKAQITTRLEIQMKFIFFTKGKNYSGISNEAG